MAKSKSSVDLALDADWPPFETTTITDLIAEARGVDWDLVIGVTQAGMTPATRMLAACSNACWLTPCARAVPACIDGLPPSEAGASPENWGWARFKRFSVIATVADARLRVRRRAVLLRAALE